MKKLITIMITAAILASFAAAYNSGEIDITGGVTSQCDAFAPCYHWIEYEGMGNERCDDTACYVGNGGYFAINNTPAVVPAGQSCNVSASVTYTANIDEALMITVNGLATTSLSDQGTGIQVVTFPDEITFIGGSDGSDILRFTGAGADEVQINWYSLTCNSPDPADIPEFSTVALIAALGITIAGMVFARRRIKKE